MKSKNIRSVFILYWFLLAYAIAALVWWYIALMQQNEKLLDLRVAGLQKNDSAYKFHLENIRDQKRRKTAQYIGEGSIFLLLISAGAIFVYRSLHRQLKLSQQQQNFMMAVTHELKTPLAITRLNLETLQKRKLPEEQQQKLLRNSVQEANRMNALCNNLLISSQIEAGGYRLTLLEINMSELIETCVHEFRDRFPSRIIESDISQNVYARADSQLIEIAVNNLIENALKYSGKEDRLKITLTSSTIIEVAVADSGPGIPDQEKKKVFEKFYRLGNEATKRAKGTGLGLYLTQRVAKAHKGKIVLKDNNPAGSIFVLELPQGI